jgi:integrase
MKPRGRHPEKALSAVAVRALQKPGRYADGNGLYLVVDPSGAKRWLLRTVVQGRRRDIGLGSFQLVSLAEARDKALQYRKLAREGGDPLEVKRKARRHIPTFVEAAEAVHVEHKVAWKNGKHVAQWINTLEQYVIPAIGEKRVDQIDTPDVLRVLSPIWLTKPATALRVRQRIGTVLDWAKAAGFRSGDNPVEGVTKGLPRQPDRMEHHAAIPYGEVASFIERLHTMKVDEPGRLAFEFLILTAARSNEVFGAKWGEIDLDKGVWTIPASRMKAGREHRVPLTPRCIEILQRAKELSAGSEYVFPGRSGKKPLSNTVFLKALQRMGLDITAHGFRSAFRDWAAEQTNFPREVCEMALAHSIKDKVEAAYRRGDLFEKRRELMAKWAQFVTLLPAELDPFHVEARGEH